MCEPGKPCTEEMLDARDEGTIMLVIGLTGLLFRSYRNLADAASIVVSADSPMREAVAEAFARGMIAASEAYTKCLDEIADIKVAVTPEAAADRPPLRNVQAMFDELLMTARTKRAGRAQVEV